MYENIKPAVLPSHSPMRSQKVGEGREIRNIGRVDQGGSNVKDTGFGKIGGGLSTSAFLEKMRRRLGDTLPGEFEKINSPVNTAPNCY